MQCGGGGSGGGDFLIGFWMLVGRCIQGWIGRDGTREGGYFRSVSIATSDRNALGGRCLMRLVTHTRGKRYRRRQRLVYARKTDVDANGLRRHVLVRSALRLDIVRCCGQVRWRATVGDDELAQACNLLSRCDKRIGQPLVLRRKALDLCLQVLQPLLLALAALEGSLKASKQVLRQ